MNLAITTTPVHIITMTDDAGMVHTMRIDDDVMQRQGSYEVQRWLKTVVGVKDDALEELNKAFAAMNLQRHRQTIFDDAH